jgi:hypothetical protein
MPRHRGPMRGDDLRLDLKLDFTEAVFGGEKEIKISHLEPASPARALAQSPVLAHGPAPPVVDQGRFVGQPERLLAVLHRSLHAPPAAVVGKLLKNGVRSVAGVVTSRKLKS